jgi:hypothetical protein
MLFRRRKESESARLYRALRAFDQERLARGAPAGGDSRYVAFSRGCGGGPSFVIREETAEGACRAYAILALYEEGGIEESSFASPSEAVAFVAAAVERLARA